MQILTNEQMFKECVNQKRLFKIIAQNLFRNCVNAISFDIIFTFIYIKTQNKFWQRVLRISSEIPPTIRRWQRQTQVCLSLRQSKHEKFC